MSFRQALSIGLSALALASASPAEAVTGEALPDLVGQFTQICGRAEEAGTALPGNDVAVADAPAYFAGDLRRATESRVVKMGERYAMRAIIPSDFDPQHAVLMKCAVASGATAFAEQVERLSALLSAKPELRKTAAGFDAASFTSGATVFYIFSEPDGWVSVYKMDIMMRNIPRKYLKKGAKPLAIPSVR
jgi:hypothetical protein